MRDNNALIIIFPKIVMRAWDAKNKEMINDITISPEDGWIVMSDNDALCEGERPKRGQITLMLRAPECDINGKYIHVGDIFAGDSGEIGVVVFGNYPIAHAENATDNNPKFALKYMCGEYGDIDGDGKVLGNIFEHMKLLKEGGGE